MSIDKEKDFVFNIIDSAVNDINKVIDQRILTEKEFTPKRKTSLLMLFPDIIKKICITNIYHIMIQDGFSKAEIDQFLLFHGIVPFKTR